MNEKERKRKEMKWKPTSCSEREKKEMKTKRESDRKGKEDG